MGETETETPKLVYIVDDEPLVTRALRRNLISRYGDAVRIELFASAEKVLLAMQTERLDLLITDLEMPPGMHGDELMVEARRLNPKLPIILHTGNNNEYVRITSGTIGARDRFIQKPSPMATYHRAIDELLSDEGGD